MKTNIKIIATSLALASSVSAWAGMGGLSVQSHLGQPFSGSIVVTGDEAEALKSNRRVVVSGSGIRGTVIPQGNGNVVVRLRSSSPIREPMINFTVSAGRQSREYTAMLNPSNYVPEPAPRHVEKNKEKPRKQPKAETQQPSSGSLKSGQRDFIERNGQVAAHQDNVVESNTMPVERKPARKNQNNVEQSEREVEPRRTKRETRERTAPVTTGAVNQVRPSGKAAVATRRHRAQVGETLSSIANRYRPRNMSLQTASRALAIANPAAFKRGNTIQRSTTLYIPSASQWQAYAQRAQSSSAAPVPKRQRVAPSSQPVYQPNDIQTVMPNQLPPQEPVVAPQPTSPASSKQQVQTPPPAVQPNQNNTAKAAPAPTPSAPPAQPVTPPPAAKPPVNTQPEKVSTPSTQPQPAAVAPQEVNAKSAGNAPAKPVAQTEAPSAVPPTPVAPATTSAPAPAAKVAATSPNTTPPAVASTPIQAASVASLVATTVAVGSGVAGASVPVPPPLVASTQPVPQPTVIENNVEALEEEEGENINWSLYGTGIVAVGLVAGAAAFFLRKRRSENEEDEAALNDLDDDDDVQWEEEPASIANRLKPAATAVAATTVVAADEQDDGNDEFETMPADETVAPKPFDLNNFEPDAASLENDLVATSMPANADDDWSWDTPIDTLGNTAQMDETDWSLDDGTTEPVPTEYSLDEALAASSFDDFGEDADFAQAMSKPQVETMDDDIEAMFADSLSGLDTLQAESGKSAITDEMDEMDAMLADVLPKMDELDDELAAFERPKAQPLAEVETFDDDIDALLADKLGELDDLPTAPSKPNPLAEADDLDALFANKFGDTNTVQAASSGVDDDLDALLAEKFGADDDLDALFADKFGDVSETQPASAAAIENLDALFASKFGSTAQMQPETELDTLEALAAAPHDDLDDKLFAGELAVDEFDAHENTSPTQASAMVDDIDSLLMDELNDLEASLSQDNDSLVSAAELDSLNSLSDFDDELANFNSKPAHLDNVFANVLSDIDTPLKHSNEPVIKPILSEEDIENFNSLSELDSLEANEATPDTLFANALDDLDIFDNTLSTQPEMGLSPDDVVLSDDALADAMAFDLSEFDALQNTSSEVALDTHIASDEVDSLAFDLSGFDSLTDTVAAEEAFALPESDDVDTLAFAAPEISALSEASLETPELTTPAVDFELPDIPMEDELTDLAEFSNSLDELEMMDNFQHFDLPDGEGEVGFVSGAVGEGETPETKLALAKMFIEIEDKNAARAVLSALETETEGEMLAEIKNLMAQIS